MKSDRKYLWLLLVGTLLPLAFVAIDGTAEGGLSGGFFSFNRFLAAYWWFIAIGTVLLMTVLVSVHALMNRASKWWTKIVWVTAFWLISPIAVPVYSIVNLRKP